MGFIKGIISYIVIAWIYMKIGQTYPIIGSPDMWYLWMGLIPIALFIMLKVHATGFLKTFKNVACGYTLFISAGLFFINSASLLRADVWFIVMLGVVTIPFIAIFILKIIGNYMLYYNAGYDFIRHINNKN